MNSDLDVNSKVLTKTIGDVKVVARFRTMIVGRNKKAELTIHGISNNKARKLKAQLKVFVRKARRFPPTLRVWIGSRPDPTWTKPGFMYIHFEGPTNAKKDLVRKCFDFVCERLQLD